MGAFAIYAFVLTGIYLAYYTVVIFIDLYGDNLKAKSSDSETVSVTDEKEHKSVKVKETADGYTVGDEPSSASVEKTDIPSAPHEPAADEAEGSAASEVKEISRQYHQDAEPVNPEWERQYNEEDFARQLIDGEDEDSGVKMVRIYQ